MIKLAALKKRLIKVSIASVIIVASLGAGAAAIYSWSGNVAAEKKKSESTLAATRRDISQREEKAKESIKIQERYNEIKAKQGSDQMLDINSEIGKAWIAQAGIDTRLVDMTGKFSTNKAVANPDFNRKSLITVQSSVDANIIAMTDEDLIRFVEKVYRDFPGYVKIIGLDMTRENDITDDILVSIPTVGKPSLVNGKMQFIWLGVKPVANADAKPAEGEGNAQ